MFSAKKYRKNTQNTMGDAELLNIDSIIARLLEGMMTAKKNFFSSFFHITQNALIIKGKFSCEICVKIRMDEIQ